MVNDGTMNLAIGIWVVKTKGDNHAKTLWNEKEKKEIMHSMEAVKALWEAASKIDPDLSK